MPTFKITLAYDGTDFVGWQRQATGRSVQGLVEDALTHLAGSEVAVAGAGRTDAGVHALGQVASFSLERIIDAAVVARALNARLPPTVRVTAAECVADGFHARFGARSKTYRYRIWNARLASPFELRYAWHVFAPLDREAMDRAARLLEGAHDFAAFQTTGGSVRTTARVMTESRISAPTADLITYDITGNGFLRYMVRAIVGTLVEVGRGQRGPESLAAVLESRDRGQAGPTAPPEGLFLVGVEYGA